jgi:hypothetical protein
MTVSHAGVGVGDVVGDVLVEVRLRRRSRRCEVRVGPRNGSLISRVPEVPTPPSGMHLSRTLLDLLELLRLKSPPDHAERGCNCVCTMLPCQNTQ